MIITGLNEARRVVTQAIEYASIAQRALDMPRLTAFTVHAAIALTIITERSKQPKEVKYAEHMLELLADDACGAWDYLVEDDYDTGSPYRFGWKTLGGYTGGGIPCPVLASYQ
jgi:hypothetical protein